MDEFEREGLKVRDDCKKMIPALQAWFESQGVARPNQAIAAIMYAAVACAETASSRNSLSVGLTLLEAVFESYALTTFMEKLRD
jgi:hypothetical protein